MIFSGFFWIWFSMLFLLPHIFIFMLTYVHHDIASLKGLNLEPVVNNDGSVFAIHNNYNDFIARIKVNNLQKEYNVIIKILKQMCDDANNGEKYHPEIYTSILKNFYARFFVFMLLCSFFPAAAGIISNSFQGGLYNFILCQLLCSGLVFAFNIIIRYMYSAFLRLFFRVWYNKILNFDLAAVNEIKSIIQKDNALKKADSLNDIFLKLTSLSMSLNDQVSVSISLISNNIDELKESRKEGKIISSQEMLETLQSGIGKAVELGATYENIAEKINTALNDLNEYVALPKTDINIINKNASLLRELRDRFSKYKEDSQSEQLKLFKKVTEKLDKNVREMFLSVESTLKQITEKLNDSYNSFSDMCTKFNENYSHAIDSKQISDALTLMIQENKKLTDYFDEISDHLKDKSWQ